MFCPGLLNGNDCNFKILEELAFGFAEVIYLQLPDILSEELPQPKVKIPYFSNKVFQNYPFSLAINLTGSIT